MNTIMVTQSSALVSIVAAVVSAVVTLMFLWRK